MRLAPENDEHGGGDKATRGYRDDSPSVASIDESGYGLIRRMYVHIGGGYHGDFDKRFPQKCVYHFIQAMCL